MGSCDMGMGSSEVSDIGNGGAEGIGGERAGVGGGEVGVGGTGIDVGIVKRRIAEVERLVDLLNVMQCSNVVTYVDSRSVA